MNMVPTAIAIGAGPSNLSLAALAQSAPMVNITVLERAPQLAWHHGLLVSGAMMQTNPLKDLVTLVDPKNPFGFLSYLKAHGRLYRAIVRGFDHVSRAEFDDYLRWVAQSLPNVRFCCPVTSVELSESLLKVSCGSKIVMTRNVVLGIGRTAVMPKFANISSDDTVFHSSQLLTQPRNFGEKRVVVVGGGQSGAEVFCEILKGRFGQVETLSWISQRPNLFALEESPFVNEWFFPQHGRWFHGLNPEARLGILSAQKYSSDGISTATLAEIYRLLYEDSVGQKVERTAICVGSSVEGLHRQGKTIELSVRNSTVGECTNLAADVVVFCTGYRFEFPEFLESLRPRFDLTELGEGQVELPLDRDFSAKWDGPRECRIFVQNGGRSQHGIADPNLSLTAWRSAVILNALAGCVVHDCEGVSGALNWNLPPNSENAMPQAELSSNVCS